MNEMASVDELTTAQRARAWLMDVDSDDPALLRRARTFIPLMTILTINAVGGTLAMILFFEDNAFVSEMMLLGTASLTSSGFAVALARRGWMDAAGFVAGCTMLVVFAVVGSTREELVISLGWFFGVGVLLASYAVRPKMLLVVWAFAQSCMAAMFVVAGTPQLGVPSLWLPSMSMLLMFVVIASYLHASSTEFAFSKQLENAVALERARAGRGGEQGEVDVPGVDVARAAHAAQRHHRLLRDARGGARGGG